MNKKIRNALRILSATLLALSIIQTLPISTASANITLTLSKHSGNVGEKILVLGIDAPPGSLITVYWDIVINKTKLNETYAKGDGTFSCYIKIPEDAAGSHWVIADGASAEFFIEPDIAPKPTIGLPDDIIAVNGTGFAAEKGITVAFGNKTATGDWDWSIKVTTTPSPVKTDINGSFICTFKVSNMDYGDYIVNATDDDGNWAEAAFRVSAAIKLDPINGTSGTIVTISGRGFTKVANKAIRVTINGTSAPVVADIETKADGTFTGQFIVPTLDEKEYILTAIDETGISSNATFQVTKKTVISLTPRAGAPGIEVTIKGTCFTNIANTEVTVKFGVLALKNFHTNSTGGFKGTIIIPSLPNGIYNVTAKDTSGLNATMPFRIIVTGLALSPTSGPTGTLVKVIGYGFTSGRKANITIDTVLKLENINVTELEAGITFRVPTVPVGVYTVTAIDEEGLKASATFKVTATTVLTLTPDKGTHNATISLEARCFTLEAGTPLTFTIKNSTWKISLTVNPTSPWTEVKTDETGRFKGTFEVPDSKTIALGNYIVEAKDDNGLVAKAPLSVILPTVYIRTRSSEYMPGDTISFYVNSTFTCRFTIRIIGPLGFIKELTISDADWQTIGSWKIVPYEKASFALPSDAELGVWNWSAALVLVKTSGSFTVIKPTIEKLNEEITLLKNKLSNLEGNLSSLREKLDEISSKVDALSEESEETLSSLKNDINNIQRDLNALKNHVSEAEEAAQKAQQTASNLTTTTYIVLAISIAAAIAAILAFIAIIELGRMIVRGLKL